VREVVIIGGGLSGLAAAWELATLHIPYTLIEVKRRFGGAIISECKDGFVMDGGTLFVPRGADWTWLAELGLHDALIAVDDERAVFRDGTQMLIDALAKKLSAPAMMRMAVSSVGRLNERVFGVCLENGILLDARALIVAAPARYAEKMLRELQCDVALRLFDFRYEHVLRVSLGYRRADIANLVPPADAPIAFVHRLHERAPAEHVLLQVGLRFEPTNGAPQDPIAQITTLMGWHAPLMSRVDYWAEADLVRDAQVTAHLQAITMPTGTALTGSDYLSSDSLSARVAAGRAAARQIAAYLG
jgi:predicted NAD/FAD-dependent oxidoreductase